jgi:hypothetical protein
VIGPESDPVVFRRIAERVQEILSAAEEREEQGQVLAVDIEARFRLQDLGAVQFQLATAILEEAGGLRQEEVVGELLSLGLAAVLDGAAKVAKLGGDGPGLDLIDEIEHEPTRAATAASRVFCRPRMGGRVLN